MCVKEILEMTAKFAASIAAILAAVALFLNTRAFRLQRRSLEANLFNDIRRRIDELTDQHAGLKAGDIAEKAKWYGKIFGLYESYAFYANRGYLEKDMSTFFSSGISVHLDRVIAQPELKQHLKRRNKEEFAELEKYCLRVLKRELPF